MKVIELIQYLQNCKNQNATVVIDMIDRTYSCFDFHVDNSNTDYVYFVNDSLEVK